MSRALVAPHGLVAIRVVGLVVAAVLCPAIVFGDVTAAQRAEVQHLLAFIERSGCIIDRNGIRHASREARPHIEKKYDYFRDRIRSTEDFIALAASRSTVSGTDYRVECPGQPLRRTEEWLLEELARYRAARAAPTR